MIGITHHFRSRWIERVEPKLPDPAEIAQIVRESTKIQSHRVLYTARGDRAVILARYWHPLRGLVLVVDDRQSCAVTVYSTAGWFRHRQEQERKRGAA